MHQAEYLLLPRLAVTAELGWSDSRRHDWADLRERLAAQEPLWTALESHSTALPTSRGGKPSLATMPDNFFCLP
jgi:N-acetyl-beta-hexosaminidase